MLERFVIVMYDRTSHLTDVDDARKKLFSRKGKFNNENLPPTRVALLQHCKIAAYQSGHVWGQALTPWMNLPNPADCGWFNSGEPDEEWKPYWSALPQISFGCRELIAYHCKKDSASTTRCGCRGAQLQCSTLCACSCTDGNFHNVRI